MAEGALASRDAVNPARYNALMEVILSRRTSRAFAPHGVPREHIEMILVGVPIGVPDELDIIGVMCFGPPLKPPYKRWKKSLVMYRDESKID